MLSFVLTGRVEKISSRDHESEIAVASKRMLQSGKTSIDWVTCRVRHELARDELATQLHLGAIVRIHGWIEPRRREIEGVAFYDVVLVAHCFEVLRALPALEPQCCKRERGACAG